MRLRGVGVVGVLMGAMGAVVLVGMDVAFAMVMGMLVLVQMLMVMTMPVGVRVGLFTVKVFVLMLVLVAVDVPVLMVSLPCRASPWCRSMCNIYRLCPDGKQL